MLALYALSDQALLEHCRVKQVRSQGPGGQHAQKNATAIQLHEPNYDIEVRCQDFRDVESNRKRALKEMRVRLAVHQRACADRACLRQFQNGTRINCTPKSHSYHLVVAILLDVLDEYDYEIPVAAKELNSSTSQIIACLKLHKYVYAFVQQRRDSLGLKKLH